MSSQADRARPEFFATLGLLPPCTVEDVKQAYLERAKTAHPDAGGDVSKFVQLQKAYEQGLEYAEFRASRMGWLAKQIDNYVYQEKVIDRLNELGGKVDVAPINWLKRSFGEDFAQVVERITQLQLRGPHIGNSEVAYLALERRVLASLQDLDLSRTKITDAGVPHLLALVNLKRLNLSGTKVTRISIETLRRLPELEWLSLSETGFGWWDRVRLRRALPYVTTVFDPAV